MSYTIFRIAILLSVLFNGSVLAQTVQSNKVTVKVTKPAPKIKSTKTLQQQHAMQLLQGAWTDNPEDNAVFYIKGNKMLFFESTEPPVIFNIVNNVLSMNFGNGLIVKKAILKITKDSLVLRGDGNVISRLGRMR